MIEPSLSKAGFSTGLRRVASWGPGLLVMLADCDAGNVVTAAQAGAQSGMRLLVVLLGLIPLLYMIQELTVRLGIFTGKGYGELIRSYFGPVWVWVSIIGLLIAVLGSLVTELTGVAGVGEMYGISRSVTLPAAVVALTAVLLTGSYKRMDSIAIAIGAFELTFFVVAWKASQHIAAPQRQLTGLMPGDRQFGYLAAAVIGATFSPWMVFFQQAAVVDKSLRQQNYTAARIETGVGAVLTQLLTGAVLVAAAATLFDNGHPRSLQNVGEIAAALATVAGPDVGRLLFSVGVLGASLVAAIVCSLSLAWGLGEVAGYKRSPDVRTTISPWFRSVYAMVVATSACVVWLVPDLVSLNVAAQVVNALMLPLVVGLLVVLGVIALPRQYRLRGIYLWLVCGTVLAVCTAGVLGAVSGFIS